MSSKFINISLNQSANQRLRIFYIFLTANERIFYSKDKIFKVDYVCVFIQLPINSQYYMLSSGIPMIYVLHNIMWSIGKSVWKEKLSTKD